MGDSEIDKASDNLSEPCQIARHSRFGAELDISSKCIATDFQSVISNLKIILKT